MSHVLFIDLAPSPGGSIHSLYQLVSHLDRTQVEPSVALSVLLDFDAFDRLDVPVRRVRTPWWEGSGAGPVDRLRSGPVGEVMRRSRARSWLWHRLGDLRRLWRDLLPTARILAQLYRHARPDLVHLNDAVPLVRPALLASRWTGVPALVHARSFLLPTAYDERFLAPAIAGMIFISQAVADAQLAAMSHRPAFRVIPNAVDPAQFSAAVDPATVRAELGVAANVPLVGMFGRIAPWKGQHVFVEAMALLRRHRPDALGVIVGAAEGESGRRFQEQVIGLIDALDLADGVRLLGHRPDVPRLLAAVDVVAHCSVQPEPFGRVIIEGMAAGRPVVASAAGGSLEIITDGVDGLLTPPRDPKALAEALERLLADPALRRRLAAAARQTVVARYSIDRHVAAVQAFYADVLHRRRHLASDSPLP